MHLNVCLIKLINIYQFKFKVFRSSKYFIERAKLVIFGWMLLMWNYTAKIRNIFNALMIKLYDLLVRKRSDFKEKKLSEKKWTLFDLQ